MFTIVVGEEERYEEYARRLVKYLETHWKGPLRIYSYTQPQQLLRIKDADCYLLGENFVSGIRRNEELSVLFTQSDIRNREIVIADGEQEGCFCRYHAPKELLRMICERMPTVQREDIGGNLTEGMSSCRITGIISPVFDPELRSIATTYMESGDLYLGMEDMNDFDEQRGDMGDLCYFIHLKDEEIVLRIRELAEEVQELFFVESPDAYFDLLELEEEEFQWFFDRLRQERAYPEVYVGIGCGVLGRGEILKMFDRLLFIDSREKPYQHAFCSHLEKAIQAGVLIFNGAIERRYREDILHESL